MNDGEKLRAIVYNHVLEGLVSGKYKSGKYINIDSLSHNLNVSKTPIREALAELESENLISRDGRYYYVFTLSAAEVMMLYDVKRVLEGEAAFLATLKMNETSISEMEKITEDIKEILKSETSDPVRLAELSGNFHSIVAGMSGNKYLLKYIEEIRLKLKIVRLSLFTVYNRRIEDLEEHINVLKCIKSGDPELARNAMFDHQDKVTIFVKENLLMQFYQS